MIDDPNPCFLSVDLLCIQQITSYSLFPTKCTHRSIQRYYLMDFFFQVSLIPWILLCPGVEIRERISSKMRTIGGSMTDC